eukprot:scaffold257691_cov17-Tisochrysis_lutea.AAC.1
MPLKTVPLSAHALCSLPKCHFLILFFACLLAPGISPACCEHASLTEEAAHQAEHALHPLGCFTLLPARHPSFQRKPAAQTQQRPHHCIHAP